MGRYVTGKLANMRKPQQFTVQRDQNHVYLVQSDKSIGQFDGSGRGILNTKGQYFHHLIEFLGAKAFTFPAEFVQECQEVFMLPGEKIGEGVYFGGLSSMDAEGQVKQTKSLLRKWTQLDNKFVTHDKVDVQKGEMLWHIIYEKLLPYDGDGLAGRYLRHSPEELQAMLDELKDE